MLLLLSHFSRVWFCATHRQQPTRLRRPWDSPGKDTGVGCHFLLQRWEGGVKQIGKCLCLRKFSCIWFFVTLWTIAHQAPLSMGLSRQEYWSGVPLPSPFFCEIQPKHIAVPATVAAAVYDVLSWQSLYLASICWFLEFFFFTNFVISETQVSKNYHPETLVFLTTKFVFLHRITLKINQGSLWSIPNFWDSEISSNRSRYRKNQPYILKINKQKAKKRKSNT